MCCAVGLKLFLGLVFFVFAVWQLYQKLRMLRATKLQEQDNFFA